MLNSSLPDDIGYVGFGPLNLVGTLRFTTLGNTGISGLSQIGKNIPNLEANIHRFCLSRSITPPGLRAVR